MKKTILITAITTAFTFSSLANGTELVEFVAGQPAKASEVNSNFNSLNSQITSNKDEIDTTNSRVDDVSTNVSENKSNIENITTLVEVNKNSLDKLTTEVTSLSQSTSTNTTNINELDTELSTSLQALESTVNSNSATIDTLISEVESIKNNSTKQMFLEDVNGLKVGNLIESEQGGEEGYFELESIEMVIGIHDLLTGKLSADRHFSYTQENCQGNEYLSVGDEILYSRLAKNGVLVGYDDSNDLIYSITADSEFKNEIIKSYYNNGECINQDNSPYKSTLATYSTQNSPEELSWGCEATGYGDEEYCYLQLKGALVAPFFLNK